jgi:hypothetical protein
MYRKNFTDKSSINYIINLSSIGDSVCALIPLIYLIKNHGMHDLKIWMGKDKDDLYLPFIPQKYINYTYDHFKEVGRNIPTKVASERLPISNTNGNLTDYFCWSLLNRQLELEDKIYPKFPVEDIDVSRFNIDFSKCVILCVNYIWLNKVFISQTWNEVIDYIISIGLIPLFIGKNMEMEHGHPDNKFVVETGKKVNFDKGISLLNQTTLKEVVKIISLSKMIIGPDNGLLHVAGMTDTPIIGAYTVKSHIDLMPVRKNKEGKAELGYKVYPILPEVECRFCVSNMLMTFNHDFRYCYYNDYKCVREITGEIVINKIKEVISDANNN